MRSIHVLLAAAGLVAIAGCASTSSSTAAAPADAAASGTTVASAQPQQICTKEIATGTTVAHTVCRTPQTEEERQQALRDFARTRTAAGATH
jgi:hypothetical protein